jgi:hypothetical protein
MTIYRTKFFGETVEIKANFAQASCPVVGDPCGRQVADFRHYPAVAMRAVLNEIPCDGDLEEYKAEVKRAVEAMEGFDEEQQEIADILKAEGEQFTGNDPLEMAQEWIDNEFDASSVEAWASNGFWCPEKAAIFRDAGHSPDLVVDAVGSVDYDGDLIYDICNNDADAELLLSELAE